MVSADQQQTLCLTKLPLMHQVALGDLPAHPDDIAFEWPKEEDIAALLAARGAEDNGPTKMTNVTFQKPYMVYGLHWVLSNGVSSPMFNSHPDDEIVLRKSPPEHTACLDNASGTKRITRVSFAIKRVPASHEPNREEVQVTGVRFNDGVTQWPFVEFVRGDPVGTWDSQDVPEGSTLVGFHGIMSKYVVGGGEYHDVREDGSMRLTRIGLILAKQTPS